MLNRTTPQKIHDAQIALLLKQFRVTGIANVLILTLAAVVIWAVTGDTIVIPWVLLGYLLVALRSLTAIWDKKLTFDSVSGQRLERFVAFSLVLSGVHWSTVVWLYYDSNSFELFVFLSAIYLGLLSGSIPSLSARFPVWLAYAASLFVSPVIKMLYLDEWPMAIMMTVYFVAAVFISRNLSRQIEHSITQDLRNEELLNEVSIAKENAEKANLAKSKFMASASHDLRQPLHVQSILLEVLNLRLDDKELKVLVDKIMQSNSALTSLFNALLEISQLEAGTLKVNMSHQHLNDICDNLFEEYRILAQQKELLFSIKADSCIVISDPILLKRILSNLLSNALKFTQKGGISVVITNTLESVEIVISDTGIGIDPSQHKKIFEEYEQIGNQARDRSKGIGLGLALVSRLCELLNHKVELSSALLKGSEFKITLAKGDASKIISVDTDINQSQIDNIDILLIDDEKDVVEAMTLMLTNWGGNVKGAVSINDALTLIDDTPYVPDLIISDYRLSSDETGLDALSILHNKIGKKIPSLIITGDTDPELLEQINQQNLYVLHKPVKAQRLKKVINILIKQQSNIH